MRVKGVTTKQNHDISVLLNELAGDNAVLLAAICSAESALDELSTRNGVWPDVSGGLTHVIAKNLGYTQDNLATYWAFIYNRYNALMVGWKYLSAAISRMNGDPYLSLLSYNKGPMYSRDQLDALRKTDPETKRRYDHYASHYTLMRKYEITDMPTYTFRRSPNIWSGGMNPVGICDHITGGAYDGSVDWLCNPASQVSAHFVVAQDGRVIQLVKLTDRAWAQGITRPDVSEWSPLISRTSNPNDYFISIEHEGVPGDPNFMNPRQYAASLGVHVYIAQAMGWQSVNRNMLAGHYQFNIRTRPDCPSSAFPFNRLVTDINAALSGDDMATIAELQAQLQKVQADLDNQRGINSDLQNQLANCQELKFQVEDRLSRQVGDLMGQVTSLSDQVKTLQGQLANSTANSEAAAKLSALKNALTQVLN